jgi:hypothetical protein
VPNPLAGLNARTGLREKSPEPRGASQQQSLEVILVARGKQDRYRSTIAGNNNRAGVFRLI